MLNTTSTINKTSFNSPASGIIQKSNNNSFFVRMHQKSKLAEEVFDNHPKHNDKDVVVLQVLLTHESWFLVEMIYDEYFAKGLNDG